MLAEQVVTQGLQPIERRPQGFPVVQRSAFQQLMGQLA